MQPNMAEEAISVIKMDGLTIPTIKIADSQKDFNKP